MFFKTNLMKLYMKYLIYNNVYIHISYTKLILNYQHVESEITISIIYAYLHLKRKRKKFYLFDDDRVHVYRNTLDLTVQVRYSE